MPNHVSDCPDLDVPPELLDVEFDAEYRAEMETKERAIEQGIEGEDNAPAELVELNDAYFLIDEGGHHFVATERVDPIRQRRVLVRYSIGEFRTRFMNRFVFPQGSEKPANLSKVWLSWLKRRQYLGGVVFDPGGAIRRGVYNLWRGWPIPPKGGDWSVIREHIYEVLCSSNDSWFEYVLGWLARLVQHPDEPGEVALVFRGTQGAGKSITGTAIRRMFGQHAMAISSPRALTGQFNAHLRDLCFLLADEALFAGDRATGSALKAIITDPTLFIEQKGIDAIETRNMLHIMMTTNSEWSVPLALKDRRFAVFDAADCRVGDNAYFERLAAAVRDDAVIAAMLRDLLSTSLDGYQVRSIPETTARAEQKAFSLDPACQWLLHVLTVGDLGIDQAGWREWASVRDIQTSHENWARNGRHRDALSPSVLGRTLTRVFGPVTRPGDGASRPRGYRLRQLPDARTRFLETTRLPVSVFTDPDPVQVNLDGAEGLK